MGPTGWNSWPFVFQFELNARELRYIVLGSAIWSIDDYYLESLDISMKCFSVLPVVWNSVYRPTWQCGCGTKYPRWTLPRVYSEDTLHVQSVTHPAVLCGNTMTCCLSPWCLVAISWSPDWVKFSRLTTWLMCFSPLLYWIASQWDCNALRRTYLPPLSNVSGRFDISFWWISKH